MSSSCGVAQTVSTVADTLGSTYTSRVTHAGVNTFADLRDATLASGGTNNVTVTFSATVQFRRLVVHEYSNVNAFDVAAGANGTASPCTSGNITTAQAGELIFSVVYGDQTQTATYTAETNESFTIREQFGGGLVTQAASEDAVQVAAGSTHGGFSFTGGANSQNCLVAAYKLLAAGAVVQPSTDNAVYRM